MLFYFVTIDKCSIDIIPLTSDYWTIVKELKKQNLSVHGNLYCFENKTKKATTYIHMHCIMQSENTVDYSKCKHHGYSIRVSYLKTISDLARSCSYINKEKLDSALLTYDRQKAIRKEQLKTIKIPRKVVLKTKRHKPKAKPMICFLVEGGTSSDDESPP